LLISQVLSHVLNALNVCCLFSCDDSSPYTTQGDKEEASSLASAARSIAKSHVSYPKTPQLSQAGSNTEVEELIEAKQIDDFLGTKQELNLEE
jgi:hypothetical protein